MAFSHGIFRIRMSADRRCMHCSLPSPSINMQQSGYPPVCLHMYITRAGESLIRMRRATLGYSVPGGTRRTASLHPRPWNSLLPSPSLDQPSYAMLDKAIATNMRFVSRDCKGFAS